MPILPYRPEAPVDHFPWGTIVLIAINVVIAVVLGFPQPPALDAEGEPLVNALTVKFGTINPVTWMTSVFVHFGWGHLFFNMISLWSFGLMAEGLLGWRFYVPAYLSIGTAVSAILQIAMLGADGGQAAGASGAIYGVMAMAALWAPQNKLETLIWIFPIVRTVEIPVFGFAAFFVGMDLLFAMFKGFSMGSEVAHLLGAGFGLAVATWMLRKGLVDTGGWDWFALRRGRPTRIVAGPGPAPKPKETPADALTAIRNALEQGNAIAADARYAAARQAEPAFRLPRDDFLRLVEALARSNAPATAIERMEEYLTEHPEGPVRLTLARLLLGAKRPRRAMEHLAAIDPASETQREAKAALESEARAALGGSALELE